MGALYRYAWKNNSKRAELYGRPLKILARGKKGSIMVEFTDNGQQEIISHYALKKVKEGE